MVRLKSTKDLKAFVSLEQLGRVITSSQNPRDMAFISLLIRSGISISEAVRLEQCIEPYSLLPKEYKDRVWQTLLVNHMANHEAILKVIDMAIHGRGKNGKG